MIKIHSTKKLLAKLPLDENGMLINSRENPESRLTEDSPLGSWHANLLTIQRHNCVLFVHDASRFPVFIKELRKPDFAELAWYFEDGFMNTLLKAGADDAQMKAAASALRPLQFDSDCDRSVQGAMNQRAQEIEYMLSHEGVALADIGAYRTGAWLSEMLTKPKGAKDYIRPNEVMFGLLNELAKSETVDGMEANNSELGGSGSAGNVVSIEDYRR